MLAEKAKEILGTDFIGVDELDAIAININILSPNKHNKEVPAIPYTEQQLQQVSGSHILLLGMPFTTNGNALTLMEMRNFFGMDPAIQEPCFYNQDWYVKEEFVHAPLLKYKWYLLRKKLIDNTRAKTVEESSINDQQLPSALVCTYAFFVYYYHANHYLWENDFVWCCDSDANNDRIYIGRYFDPKGIAKNGFSIHRHLKLSNMYGSIDML